MDPQDGANGNVDNAEAFTGFRNRKRHYRRHTLYQIRCLEMFFKDCKNPNERQRNQLSLELGLTNRQIKFWFQNKRTQLKAQQEKIENDKLKAENERLTMENTMLREAFGNPICSACSGFFFDPTMQARQLSYNMMLEENLRLRNEILGYRRLQDQHNMRAGRRRLG